MNLVLGNQEGKEIQQVIKTYFISYEWLSQRPEIEFKWWNSWEKFDSKRVFKVFNLFLVKTKYFRVKYVYGLLTFSEFWN